MKKSLKFLHSLGAAGMTGALLVHLILLSISPEPVALAAYSATRAAIAAVTTWLLLPSLTLMLVSGLLAIAAYPPFGNLAWVWVKLALSLSIFQPVLMWVHGPAVLQAQLAAAAIVHGVPVDITMAVRNEQAMLWVIFAVCVANIVLAIWRPRFSRRIRAQ
jgi:hypothetical protein